MDYFPCGGVASKGKESAIVLFHLWTRLASLNFTLEEGSLPWRRDYYHRGGDTYSFWKLGSTSLEEGSPPLVGEMPPPPLKKGLPPLEEGLLSIGALLPPL
jgi:hypothetical protein